MNALMIYTVYLPNRQFMVFRGVCVQALLVSAPLVAPLLGGAAAAPAVPAAVLPMAAAPEIEIEVAVDSGVI